jgi:ferric-dicitrate binding protein FerR (iron transport regulator)
MNVPRYAALAARLLRTQVQKGSPAGDRARGLNTIDSALAHRKRRHARGWATAITAAAALALALGAYALPAPDTGDPSAPVSMAAMPSGQGAALRARDGVKALRSNEAIQAGQAIETPPRGGAEVNLATGSRLGLGAETTLRVDEQRGLQRFFLTRGELSAQVTKLASGQRFVVQTPDAEVEVRGTQFQLSVLPRGEDCGAGARTRLRVSEGRVEVRQGGTVVAMVTAGQSWPTECATHSAARPQPDVQTGPVPTPEKSHAASDPSAAAHSSTRARSASAGPSALARQNDLYAQGVASRRQGDPNAALRAYSELISQYPASPLAENAAVERVRLLAASQPLRAREEAKLYLRRYPRGFAVAEIRRIAEER